MTKGETVYKAQCLMCHQANGEGVSGVFPALVKSPIAINWFQNDYAYKTNYIR